LGEALSRARELYARNGKAQIQTDAAVQAWGYGSLNGASLRVLGALKQYGLLDDPAPKIVKLSPRALTILLEPEDSAERAKALGEAAKAPPVFAELLEHYGKDIPSDEALSSHLIRNVGFSGDGARSVIASFRDTLSLAETAANSDIPPRKQAKSDGGQEERKDRTPPPRPDTEGDVMDFNWPLSGGAVARLTVSRALDPDDVETLAAYLEIAKRTLAKEAAKAKRLGGPAGDDPEVRETIEAVLGSTRARNDTGQ
jgi:hypothetical protein